MTSVRIARPRVEGDGCGGGGVERFDMGRDRDPPALTATQVFGQARALDADHQAKAGRKRRMIQLWARIVQGDQRDVA